MDSKVLAQTLMKLAQSKNSEKSIEQFLSYLKKKNFLGLLPKVKKHIERYEKNSSQENKLVISSKHDLSDSDIKNIISLVGADTDVTLEIIKDEAVVGGFSATYAGNIYDGSLRNQITQLRTRLTHS